MKVIGLVLLLLISACGKSKKPKSDTFQREVRSFSPSTPDANTRTAIARLCMALTSKQASLSDDVATNRRFNYSVVGKEYCDAQTVSLSTPIPVVVIPAGGSYQFQSTDTRFRFPFPEIETQSNGVWQGLCANTTAMQLPIHTSGNGATAAWITVLGKTTQCEPDANHSCFMIEKGSSLAGQDYQITTREIVKYQIQGANMGHFTYRNLQTFSGCDRGYRGAVAELK